MKVSDLNFEFPESLIALKPEAQPRVMLVQSGIPSEISFSDLLEKIPADDVLLVNDTQVLKRRVFAGTVEVLFLNQKSDLLWEVLFPSKKMKVGESLELPLGLQMTLRQKGRPQLVELDRKVDENYFSQVGELPLPPYIQKVRSDRHTVAADEKWYQTAWAEKPGSFAAPTASLHFRESDVEKMRKRGVEILPLTLHVGLGTFLPVKSEDLDDHEMHEEWIQIPAATWQKILNAKKLGRGIWALGTTATRSVESAARGMLQENQDGSLSGFSKLLLQPGSEFKIVNRLLTNFHQPQSTLLALVAAFADLSQVKACYQWAIERKFRLFSYGDLSVWIGDKS